MATDENASETSDRPFLHRVVLAGRLRYWLIGSWGLALCTAVPWPSALGWFVVTIVSGLIRSWVETRLSIPDPRVYSRVKLAVATLSCVAWAGAPLLAMLQGDFYGIMLAIALLVAGYTLVFTQMRAAPQEALIVSLPYSVVVAFFAAAMWGTSGFWVALSIIPVVGLSMLIKVVITEIKDAELMTVNRRQAALINDLAAARDRADAASAAKSNFLSVISHELRTPMNGVLGCAHLLQMSELDSPQSEMVRMIQTSGESLMVLLNDILDITKIEAGKMELSPTMIDRTTLLDKLEGPFRAQAESRGLRFHSAIAGDFPEQLWLDPLRLAQVTHSLLGNAIKFTHKGSVTIAVECIGGLKGSVRLRIVVTDTGIGIAAEDQKQLFQAFTQVDESSTRKFGGAGLGLSICERLVTLMDGEISVQSKLGEGSTFTVEVAIETAFEAERVAA